MFFWLYKIKYDTESETRTANGIVTGENFTEAMEKIEKYYGRELVCVDCLKDIYDNDCLDFEAAEEYANIDIFIKEND